MQIDEKWDNNCAFASDIFLPVSVFWESNLSGLEAITKYAREELLFSFSEIARMLNRDDRTIWGAYMSAHKKMPQRFCGNFSEVTIPLTKVKDRTVSVLESIAEYLRDELGMKYSRIANLLHRNDRTVWTVYQRAKRKRRAYAG